jgi:tight adherence protein B
MFSDPEQLVDLVISASVFGLVLSLWLAWVLVRQLRASARSAKIEGRLGFRDPAAGASRSLALWLDDGKATTYVPGLARRTSLLGRLERLVRRAGWKTPAASILGAVLAALLACVLALFVVTGSLLPGLGVAAAGLLGFWFHLSRSIAKEAEKFDRQLVDALDLAARSLRAGHPLVGAFGLIAEEIEAPIGELFAGIAQQQSMGVPLEDALESAAAASPSDDLRLFAASVVIQMRSGGNLASMMERVAQVIRERMRLAHRVRVLTAQTQFSKRILVALPFVIFLVLNVINPDYVRPLYTTTDGRLLLTIGAVGLVAGAWIMNRLAVLRY